MKAQQGHRRPLARSGWLLRRSGLWLVWLIAQGSWLTASAETEVSGAVSGEWTREGSPYIVVDSTWVPENESLLITEGVDVFFNEGQGLYVFGRLNGSGTEEDSIRIRVSEGVEHWRGMRFLGMNQTEWSYLSLHADSAIVLDPYSSLTLDNSLLQGYRPIVGSTYHGIRWCRLDFSNSVLRNRSHHTMLASFITARNTKFDFGEDESDIPGFVGYENVYELTNCVIIGAIQNEFGGGVFADSCFFYDTPLGRPTGLSIRDGRILNSYVEGRVYAGVRNSDVVAVVDKTLIESGLFLSGNVNIYNSQVWGLLDIDDCKYVIVSNSVMRSTMWIDFNDSVMIDSCYFLSDDLLSRSIHSSNTKYLEITRCVIDKRMSFRCDELYFDHNTVVFNWDNGFLSASYRNPHNFTNNIFVAGPNDDALFSQDEMPYFKYNCVWGFRIACDPASDYPTPIRDIDSSNLILNPLIEWDGTTPYLSVNSPCVDAGDPAFNDDPDGSRTDIGAIFFDRRVFAPQDPEWLENRLLLNISIFPNPFNSYLEVTYSAPAGSTIKFTLYDIFGRMVFKEIVQNTSDIPKEICINSSSLSSGNYFLQIKLNQYTGVFPVFCLK